MPCLIGMLELCRRVKLRQPIISTNLSFMGHLLKREHSAPVGFSYEALLRGGQWDGMSP